MCDVMHMTRQQWQLAQEQKYYIVHTTAYVAESCQQDLQIAGWHSRLQIPLFTQPVVYAAYAVRLECGFKFQ